MLYKKQRAHVTSLNIKKLAHELASKKIPMTSHPCAARAGKGKMNMAPKDSSTTTMAKNKVMVREYDRERDVEAVEKLERSCEIGAGRGFSIVTNMMGDPLCRIRLFPLHIMLVAELSGVGEIVGVVRGCLKRVGSGLGAATTVLVGCVLGLRVSPMHRRSGIGLKLTESVEAWAALHGGQHVVAATEPTNVASRSLFVGKCGYAPSASLSIVIQPVVDVRPAKRAPDHRIKIQKLTVEQAALMYRRRFGGEPLCPSDVGAVLKAPPSLGTWLAHSGHGCRPAAWACMSLWNTCESYKLQVRAAGARTALSWLAAPVAPCLGAAAPSCGQFGFLFVYGLDGEGEPGRVRELVRALWGLAAGEARGVGPECKALVTEVGVGDPVSRHVPRGRRTSLVDDVWFVKAVAGARGGVGGLAPTSRRRFVDPRDF